MSSTKFTPSPILRWAICKCKVTCSGTRPTRPEEAVKKAKSNTPKEVALRLASRAMASGKRSITTKKHKQAKSINSFDQNNFIQMQKFILQTRPTTSRFDTIFLLVQEAAILGVLGGVLRCLSSLGGARLGWARRITTVS